MVSAFSLNIILWPAHSHSLRELTLLPSEVVSEITGIVSHILDVIHQILLLLLPILLVLLVHRVVVVHFAMLTFFG